MSHSQTGFQTVSEIRTKSFGFQTILNVWNRDTNLGNKKLDHFIYTFFMTPFITKTTKLRRVSEIWTKTFRFRMLFFVWNWNIFLSRFRRCPKSQHSDFALYCIYYSTRNVKTGTDFASRLNVKGAILYDVTHETFIPLVIVLNWNPWHWISDIIYLHLLMKFFLYLDLPHPKKVLDFLLTSQNQFTYAALF